MSPNEKHSGRQDKKSMLGHKVRRLRREEGLTQGQMAEQLGISTSYLNLIEHNQRPLTVNLLLKLAQSFSVDVNVFAGDEEGELLAGLREVFADSLFSTSDIRLQDMRDLVAVSPQMGQSVMALYAAYREQRETLEAVVASRGTDPAVARPDSLDTSLDEVRDFFHSHSNYFPEVEEAAETLWREAELNSGNLFSDLKRHLEAVHDLRVQVIPVDVMGDTIRRYNHHNRRVLLSEMLHTPARTFQLACQIGQNKHSELFDAILDKALLSNDDSRALAKMGLVNYFAAAVVMPYEQFISAARGARYDIEVLESRFGSSYEQVCHRLTSLSRPGNQGLPFFMVRIDKAGNVSKRFSAAGFHFARFGGACPRWNLHDAFRTPRVINTQVVEMPDGARYFSISRTVSKPGRGYATPPQEFAIGLGCDLSNAVSLVYGDGFNLENTNAVPIGINCRLCERLDCNQRAFPPLTHKMVVDENRRGHAPFSIKAKGRRQVR